MDQCVQDAQDAIDAIFADKNVSLEDTKARLEEVGERVQELINAIRDDMRAAEKEE